MQTEALHKKKLLAPKLRFKEFRGEWENKKYKELTTLVTNGFVGKAKDFYVESDGITYIQGYNVVEGGFNLRGIKQVSKDFHKKNKKSDLVEGDLLTIQTGDIGTTTIVTKELAGSNCHALVISRFKKELACPYFYMLLFNSQRGRNQLKTIETGSTMKHLNVGDIINLFVQFPTLPEQQKIASFLSSVDEKIQQLTRKKELIEQYKKGVMQQLFSGKLRFKDENGKAFPKWEEKRLGDVATFYNGKAYKQTELLESGKYKVLRVGNFFSNSSWYYSDLELEDNKYCDNGDLLYAWSASFGPKIWDGDKTIYHYHIWRVDNNNLITRQFLFHILNNETEVIKTRSSNGFALLHITKGTIESWKCDIPCIEEQKTISSFVDQLNKRLESLNKQIAQTQAFKKGLLQQMFV